MWWNGRALHQPLAELTDLIFDLPPIMAEETKSPLIPDVCVSAFLCIFFMLLFSVSVDIELQNNID